MGKVRIYDPVEDESREVEDTEVEQAIDLGYEVDTPGAAKQRDFEKNAGLLDVAANVGENVASGATLGLSDVAAAAALGPEYTEGRRMRDEAFGLDTAAQVAGGVLPVLLSGGSGAVAKGAAMLPTSLAARAAVGAERIVAGGIGKLARSGVERGLARTTLETAARFGTAGAIEGGIGGAGFALSEEALADRLGGYDRLGETAWAGAKRGAMFGLFGGAALGAVGGAAIGGASKLGRRFARNGDELAEFANERALKATGARGADIRKLGTDAKVQQVGEDLRNYVLKDGRNVLETFDNAESLAPKIAQARREVSAELGALRSRVSAEAPEVDASRFLQRVDAEVISPLQKSELPAIQKKARAVEEQLSNLRARISREPIEYQVRGADGTVQTKTRAPAPITYDELRAYQKDIKKVVFPDKPKGSGLPPPVPEHAQELFQTERILEDTLEQHVEKTIQRIAPEEVGKYVETRRLAESFIKADKLASKATLQNLGNRTTSPSDYAAGLGVMMGQLAAGNITAPLQGIAAAAIHKQVRERGNALLATIASRALKTDRQIEHSLSRFFAKAAAPRTALVGMPIAEQSGFDVSRALHAQKDESPAKAYDRIAARVMAASRGELTSPMVVDDVAPSVGHAMRTTQQRAAQHLAKNLPTPPRTTENPNLAQLQAHVDPDPVQLYEFARRVQAIDRPQSVLKDLERGELSVAAVDAVKNVYPAMYADMQARVIDKLGDAKELLPYEDSIRLGLIFDLPTHPTLRPEFLALTQQVYAAKGAPNAPKMGGSGGASVRSRQLSTRVEELETGEIPA